jgi:hypothetical protein
MFHSPVHIHPRDGHVSVQSMKKERFEFTSLLLFQAINGNASKTVTCRHLQNTQSHTMRIRLLAPYATTQYEKFHHGQISQEIYYEHYHPHLHAFSKDMKYMMARFPLLQYLDLKWCYVYLSTSLEAVNDDNDEFSHQDLHMRCKHLSLHSN